MKYRIQRLDDHNWTVEEFQEGGGTIGRGRFAGQEMQAKWKAPESFHRTLKDAALALLHKAAGDALLTQETTSLLEAINLAEARVIAALPQEVAANPQQ